MCVTKGQFVFFQAFTLLALLRDLCINQFCSDKFGVVENGVYFQKMIERISVFFQMVESGSISFCFILSKPFICLPRPRASAPGETKELRIFHNCLSILPPQLSQCLQQWPSDLLLVPCLCTMVETTEPVCAKAAKMWFFLFHHPLVQIIFGRQSDGITLHDRCHTSLGKAPAVDAGGALGVEGQPHCYP